MFHAFWEASDQRAGIPICEQSENLRIGWDKVQSVMLKSRTTDSTNWKGQFNGGRKSGAQSRD